jgi:hypothetical protein
VMKTASLNVSRHWSQSESAGPSLLRLDIHL